MPAPGRAAVESVPAEVEQVVNLVAEHALTRPELSLGVVALNARHAEEIRSAVSAEAAKSLALEKPARSGRRRRPPPTSRASGWSRAGP